MISEQQTGVQNAAHPGRLPVSVCMVAHDEADLIGDAVRSVVDWASEVIVLDCESVDATAAVARDAGAVVHHHANVLPEISKNSCMALASCDWVLLLDPDELLTDALKAEIAATIARNPSESGFRLPRRNFYFGTPLMRGGQYPNHQLRLVRRGRARFPGVGVHERMIVDGTVGELTEPFDHHPYPTFEIWLRKFDFYTAYGATMHAQRNVAINAASIRHHMVIRPLRRWLERLFIKRGIRDGVPGVFAASADLMTNVGSFLRYWISSGRR